MTLGAPGGRVPGSAPGAARVWTWRISLGTWQTGGYGAATGWPAGFRMAGLGARILAWLVDLVVFGVVSLGWPVAVIAAGAVTENPEAARQLVADPNVQPTVPLLIVDSGELAVFAAAWVVVAVVYPAACWALAGGLPGQRLLSLRVVDSASGANLSIPRALARSVTLNGLTAVSFAALMVAVLVLMAVEPPSAFDSNSDELSRTLAASDWGALLSIAGLAVWLWPGAMLLSTGASLDRRGLHDLVGHSTVVKPGQYAGWWPSAYPPPPGAWTGQQPAAPGQEPGVPGQPPFGPLPPPTGLAEPRGVPGTPGGAGQPPGAEQPQGQPGQPTGAQPPGPGSVWLRPDDEPEPVAGRLAGTLRVAPFGRRLSAYALDVVLVLVAYSFAALAVVGPTAGAADTAVPERDSMLVGLLTGAAQLAYFVATWSIWRGSLSQRLLGLLVVGENGDRIGLMDALVRWAVLQGPLALAISLPSGWLQAGTLAGLAWMGVLLASVRLDSGARGYHDRIAGSRVILAS
jgi:hypothetical protein